MEIKPVLSVDEIDLSDRAFWMRSGAEREGDFATLRKERPVAWMSEQGVGDSDLIPIGPGYWALTRHADILEASRNPNIFSSARGATSIQDLPPQFSEFFGGMINQDDPRHGRQRRIVSRGFTPRALGKLEETVERRADAIIDRVIERGECDFVNDIAAPLPLEIIADMMGIPDSQIEMLFRNTNIILGLGDAELVGEGDIIATALGAGAELATLMNEMAEDRRKSPRDDLTSQILNAELEDGALTGQELASFFILLVVAGNETTRNAVRHGMKALCDYPSERKKWAADFEGVSGTAVEEIVRWSTPVIFMRRSCTQDTMLGGQAMKEGDKVVLWYNSGNRDEDVFEDPHNFNLLRTPNDHVGFGGPGPHFCLGANLARREIKVMFERILRRLPDLEITGAPDYLESNFIHGIKRMPCAFSPGKPGA